MSRPIARTVAFALLYLVAMLAGRSATLDGTHLSLVWPAAGVLAVWFAGRREPRWHWADAAALTVITVAGNMATGASAGLAACFVAANLTQAYVFAGLARRWVPGLWRDAPITRLAELWRVVGAAVLSTLASAAIGPTAAGLLAGSWSWDTAAVWTARNTAGILLVGAALGELLRSRPPRRTPIYEYAVSTAVSIAAYLVIFGSVDGLPLAFTLITITVWIGLRLETTFVVLHSLVFGAVAVAFTLHGDGPFATIGSVPLRALTAQFFVSTVAVVGLALALSRDERAALLDRLRGSERAARDQAALLTTIIDTMAEGVGVLDEHGNYILRNPAAVRLLGGVTSPDGTIRDGAYYGLFHPDGSPVAPAEMPYRQAFEGSGPGGRDYLIRNAGVPEGRVIHLSATCLPDRSAAVIMFHDVTADRRHRDELRSFAGVVAHDLLNPLTTIQGWAETMRPDVAGRPDAAMPLARIERAAGRMHNLINDLLAYTTSRDAAVVPDRVDLTAVVTDIAAGRTDHAEGAGRAVPRIVVGHLPPVTADPVLTRQLLDNLIGNAIKYTAPGVTPMVTVSAMLDKSGMVRVAVTDNGIGIPPEQREAVFEDFHRAHPGPAYAGTGLGLAICRRIVERHGGLITAEPAPDACGTQMVFTLPAAPAPVPVPVS
ncbi:ATP-binding protein [Symbioplanes lichenis]|uniref:ATP-binding protein n=1 Tax=Symbioplanes lichenis TaxID=1629072 RepID=UPI002739046B|nr:ATP-binding protein [Actinoplanes lichenis]